MRRLISAAILLVILLGLLVVALSYVKLNVSPSLPYGLFRIHRMATPLKVGMLVVLHVQGWSHPSRPLLKPVAGIAGDVVCRVGGVLLIAGTDYGPVYAEWDGEPLPSAVPADRCITVAQGTVFLASRARQSKDSRYWGPVAIEQLSAIATPLLTLGTVDVTSSH